MAKRHQPQKEFSMFGPKRSKLAMSITKGRQSLPKDNEALWDDDDDDVILLATQIAESQTFGARMTETNNTEITFTEFRPAAHTSTQKQNEHQATSHNELLDMFVGDDDDDFIMLTDVNSLNVPELKSKKDNCAEPEVERFKDLCPIPEQKDTRCEAPATTGSLSHESAARRQLAFERQIKFLMDRVDTLKKENSKLNTELCDTKSKVEVKNGEATLLRDELRHIKNEMQSIKMEKMLNNNATKNECLSKLDTMSRQIKAKETQLQLKAVECSILKMCRSDESTGIDESIISNTNCGGNSSKLNVHAIMRLSTLNTMIVKSPNISSFKGHNIKIDSYSESDRRRNKLFATHLKNLQQTVSQLQCRQNPKTMSEHSEVNAQIQCSVKIVFDEFYNYVLALDYMKNCQIYSYPNASSADRDIMCDFNRLLDLDQLSPNECAGTLRRYIATLCIACQLLPHLVQCLLTSSTALQVLSKAICRLGFSTDLPKHFAVLDAIGHFLLIILSSLGSEVAEEHIQWLVGGVLKQLVFVRPNACTFRTLTECMLRCTQLPHAIPLLCTNSAKNSFTTDHVRSLYRFTHESCLIQVYAGLLEIAIPFSTNANKDHFELLTVICENHVRFVFYCFAQPPIFIHNHLSSYGEDINEEDHISTINPNNAKDVTTYECECYTKLCLSVVTLLFQLLRSWISQANVKDNAQISTISKMSVQLLHIIFCDCYLTCLFRNAEEITKQYLTLICKWWQENAELLKFNSLHMNFLRKLQNSHIVQKRVCDETNLANITADLTEWERLTKDNIK